MLQDCFSNLPFVSIVKYVVNLLKNIDVLQMYNLKNIKLVLDLIF